MQLNVNGNGLDGHFLVSNGDGSFSWENSVIPDNSITKSKLSTTSSGTNGQVLTVKPNGVIDWTDVGGVGDNAITEPKLYATNTPTSGQMLTYASNGVFTWQNPVTGVWQYKLTYTANNTASVIQFTQIPSNIQDLEIQFLNLLSNIRLNNANYIIQIGDSGGYETSGYETISLTGNGQVISRTNGIIIPRGSTDDAVFGRIRLSKFEPNSNTWIVGNIVGEYDLDNFPIQIISHKTLSSVLDRIRVTLNAPTQSEKFTTGKVSLRYR